MNTYDLVIIGGGPAGLSAAAAAKENGITDILILERDRELGGILSSTVPVTSPVAVRWPSLRTAR